MAVIADTEQHEIEAWRLSCRRSARTKEPFIVAPSEIRIRQLSAHTMDVICSDVERTKEGSVGQTEVAVRMIRRNAAFVTEKKVLSDQSNLSTDWSLASRLYNRSGVEPPDRARKK